MGTSAYDQLVLLVDLKGGRMGRLADALSAERLACSVEPSLNRARKALMTHRYDALVVAESATGGRIRSFCRDVRQYEPSLTILASLERQNPALEESLFDVGLDDIVTDKMPARVLAKRVLIRLRNGRSFFPVNRSIRLGHLIVDLGNLQIRNQGRSCLITKGQAKLLGYLIQKRGRVVTREEVTETIWGDAVVDPEGKNLDMQVMKLRRLIELDPRSPTLIRTVRGVGYIFWWDSSDQHVSGETP